MNQQHIHCIVNNCHYWESGNRCAANEILITSDEFGSREPDRATMANNWNQLNRECMETCCKTFVPKGSEEISSDGVTRMF